MKSYREHVSKQEKFSIRKLSVGVVSLAIAGLATVNTYGAEVKADEATAPATEANYYGYSNKRCSCCNKF